MERKESEGRKGRWEGSEGGEEGLPAQFAVETGTGEEPMPVEI